METEPTNRIFTSPSDLLQLETQPIGNPSTKRPKLHLQLLVPLGDEETLNACRKCSRKRPSHAPQTEDRSMREILDLEPLFREWRSACSSWPIANIEDQKIIFDINLPSESAPDGTPILWAHSSQAGFHVVEEHVSRFVQGLATFMSVRSHGRVRFGLEGVKGYRKASTSQRSSGYFKNLEKVLRDLPEINDKRSC